jgi:hypothetical protein
MAPSAAIRPEYFLDFATSSQIVTTLVVMFLFILAHVIAAFRVAPTRASRKTWFAHTRHALNSSLDLKFTCTDLHQDHRFIEIRWMQVLTHPTAQTIDITVDWLARIQFVKNNRVLKTVNYEKETARGFFWRDDRYGTWFPLLHEEILGFDALRVLVTLAADFESVQAIMFELQYTDPTGFSYLKISRIFLSIFIAYMLIVYLSFIRVSKDMTTAIACVVLGLSGIVACNPLSLFISGSRAMRFCDSFVLSAFVALFRLFCLFEIETIRSRSDSSTSWIVWAAVIFFIFYAAVDTNADFEQSEIIARGREKLGRLPSETLRIGFHIVYGIGLIVWQTAAVVLSGGFAQVRLFVFIFLAEIGSFVTLFLQVICVWMAKLEETIVPEAVFTAVHMVMGGFALFFVRSSDVVAYKVLDGKGADVEGDVRLDVERASSDGEEEGFADGEEDKDTM